jgi:hypothetical protein
MTEEAMAAVGNAAKIENLPELLYWWGQASEGYA